MAEQKGVIGSPRWPALDGLRGVAILLVLAAHVGLPGAGGVVGVTLFFVLSGYLITTLLIRELDKRNTIDFLRFYRRRVYRLLPALVLYLLGAALIASAFGYSRQWIWNETWPPLFYATNYVQILGEDLAMNWHTWSLAVEEHFYLVWPLVLVAVPTRTRTRLLGMATGLFAIWSLVGAQLFPDWIYGSTDGNAFALAAGCWVAAAGSAGRRIRFPSWAPLVGVSALVALSALEASGIRQAIVVSVAALTVWSCVEVDRSALSAAPLRYLGKVSYGVYLWHVVLLMVAGSALGSRVVAAAASVAIAAASWLLLERPLLRKRDERDRVRKAVLDVTLRPVPTSGLVSDRPGL